MSTLAWLSSGFTITFLFLLKFLVAAGHPAPKIRVPEQISGSLYQAPTTLDSVSYGTVSRSKQECKSVITVRCTVGGSAGGVSAWGACLPGRVIPPPRTEFLIVRL